MADLIILENGMILSIFFFNGLLFPELKKLLCLVFQQNLNI